MHYPETDPKTYESWAEEGWHSYILSELKDLLLFVRKHAISGLAVGRIRGATFVPFETMFNREVSLLMDEVEAYNGGPVNEDELARGWKLSGLKRP